MESANTFRSRGVVDYIMGIMLKAFNPILDGVRAYSILDGGGAKKPPGLTLPFSV